MIQPSILRVENLAGGDIGSRTESRLAHVRVWFRSREAVDGAAALLAGMAGSQQQIVLELFEVSERALRRLQHSGFSPTQIAGKRVLPIEPSLLSQVLEPLAGQSIGAWILPAAQEIQPLIKKGSNGDRAQALPADGAFVVLSLYDENAEVYATGRVASRLQTSSAS